MAAYGQSKFCAERYLGLYERLYGMSTIALRFGNVYGPRQDPHGEAGVIAIFCGKLRDGHSPRIYGGGTQTRDYVYVGDLVEALVRAGDVHDGGVVNVGTEEETSVLELVDTLRELSGRDFDPIFEPERPGEVQHISIDPSRAREELGWESRIGVREGIAQTTEWLRDRLAPA